MSAGGARAAAGATAWVALLVLLSSPQATAQKVYACPQAEGPVRYQDRPCAATLPVPALKKELPPPTRYEPPPVAASAGGAKSSGTRGPRNAAANARGAAERAPPPPSPSAAADVALPATRAQYLELNERRCREGDRRACIAVTCERSGGLGTKECRAATATAPVSPPR